MSYPSYPEYKESGIEWVGTIPSYWEVWKISHAFREIGSGTTPPSTEAVWYADGSIPWVTTSELRENTILDTQSYVTEEAVARLSSLRVHPPGSLLIAMYGATIGRMGVLGIHATTNQACCALSSPITLDPRFSFYWFSVFKTAIIEVFATGGGQPNINQETISSIRIPAPPLPEQAQIARFLDHQTARIDALIAEQQRLIELLKEKRQAVISHAVTKGLDPDVAMKDSGVEWLGEVPKHWTITRLKHYADLVTGYPFPSSGFSEDEGDIKLLRGANVGIQTLKWDDTVYWHLLEGDPLNQFLMRKDQIVIGMDRPWIGDGLRIARVKEKDLPCLLVQRVAAIDRTADELNSDFLFQLLSGDLLKAYIEPELTGVSVPHISPDQIMEFEIPLPPLEEQAAIASYVSEEFQRLDSLLAEADSSSALLQERRSALISAAVTGKIDVRDWQPPESEMFPESSVSEGMLA